MSPRLSQASDTRPLLTSSRLWSSSSNVGRACLAIRDLKKSVTHWQMGSPTCANGTTAWTPHPTHISFALVWLLFLLYCCIHGMVQCHSLIPLSKICISVPTGKKIHLNTSAV